MGFGMGSMRMTLILATIGKFHVWKGRRTLQLADARVDANEQNFDRLEAYLAARTSG